MSKLFGLKKAYHRKHVRDFVDQDYHEKLSGVEKEWLSRFNDEYYRSFFPKNEQHIHDTLELKRAVYSAKNSRNRDLYAIKKCSNLIEHEWKTPEVAKENTEEVFIEVINYLIEYAKRKKVRKKTA